MVTKWLKLLQSHLDIAQTVDQTKMLTSSNQYIRPDYLAPMPNAVSVYFSCYYNFIAHFDDFVNVDVVSV